MSNVNFYELLENPYFVLLEKGFLGRRAVFTNPLQTFTTNKLEEVKEILAQAENSQKLGFYVVGYVSYEAGYSFYNFEPMSYDFPLVWFGVFEKPIFIEEAKLKEKPQYLFQLKSKMKERDYISNIFWIKKKLQEGEIYQLNFTFPVNLEFFGNIYEVYEYLRSKQDVIFGAYIKEKDREFLSFSPELFFSREKNKIFTKPMKGTISRGNNKKQDEKNLQILKNSGKDKSENLMITDLLRNDLGKIAKIGTVQVEELFEIETYETLFQMTSSISAVLEYKDLLSVFSSLFPCGSITGAPKFRSMQLIQSLEKFPRKLYTGSLGVLKPNDTAVFNIAIRTIEISKNKAKVGLGGGITWESNHQAEYKEAILKGKFLLENLENFTLFESILFKNGIFYFLDFHLKRMSLSAQKLNISFHISECLDFLKSESLKKDFKQKYKVRLKLYNKGNFTAEFSLLEKQSETVKICLSPKKVFSEELSLYYKTSIRQIYDMELVKAQKNGYDEVIFENEKSEITEGSISNIFILQNGIYWTPPVSCGLLNGVYRQKLLKRKIFKEKVFSWLDVVKAEKVFICNSVRGIRKVIK